MKKTIAVLAVWVLSSLTLHSEQSVYKKIRMTGHQHDEIKTAKICDAIVVAKFLTLGSPDVGSAGALVFENASVVISRAIKGSLSGTTKVLYSVQLIPEVDREDPPQLNNEYILFIKIVNPGELRILKMIPADSALIDRVTHAIHPDR